MDRRRESIIIHVLNRVGLGGCTQRGLLAIACLVSGYAVACRQEPDGHTRPQRAPSPLASLSSVGFDLLSPEAPNSRHDCYTLMA
jgi:hypothetical protein